MYVTICFDIEILNAKTDGMYVEIPPITKLRKWHALNPKLQRLHDVGSLITSASRTVYIRFATAEFPNGDSSLYYSSYYVCTYTHMIFII